MDNEITIDPGSVLSSIYNGIVVIDSNGAIVHFNGTAEKVFGIAGCNALNRHILDILPNTGGKLLESLRTGSAFYGVKLKGEAVTLIANITPIEKNHKISGVVSVFQDISEIENISKELDVFKNMKNWLDAIIDSSYDGLWICDHQGKVIRINNASERINNLKAQEVLGRNLRELVAQGLFDKVITFEVLEKRTSLTTIQKTKSGKLVLITGSPIFNEKGEIIFIVINERDINDLDNLRIQLQDSQALAKEYISKLSELEMKGVDLSTFVFKSEVMKKIIGTAIRVAPTNSTVLLLGESGVGKGMIARIIHRNSDRRAGPFIGVDCGGIPDSLIESELFGYAKGAFTGARPEGKPGFFELANQGTLFLDEIGEIPLGSQSKLLHFLEDHEIIRVGGTEHKKVDVRVIAATNRNIEEMVSQKLFRKDLFYRLNVVPLYIPPLRERKEDVLPLAIYFIKKFNNIHGKRKSLSPEAIECFCKHDFPGNIRELANLVERMIIVVEGDRIDIKDLPDIVKNCLDTVIPYVPMGENISLKAAVNRYEKIVIETTVGKAGSLRKAAKVLKVNHATLSKKLRKYPN